ncbi:hypothetical protein D9M69_477520 [compost metagenome]
MSHICLLLPHRRHVVQRRGAGVLPRQLGDHPGRQVRRGEAAAGGGQVARREERLVQHLHTGLDHPGLGGEVGAGRQAAEQAEFRHEQGARALRADQLARRVQAQTVEDAAVLGDIAGQDAAAEQHHVGGIGEFQRLLGLHPHTVHRGDPFARRGDLCLPALPAHAVEQPGGDKGIQLVEALERQYGDTHHDLPDRLGAWGESMQDRVRPLCTDGIKFGRTGGGLSTGTDLAFICGSEFIRERVAQRPLGT